MSAASEGGYSLRDAVQYLSEALSRLSIEKRHTPVPTPPPGIATATTDEDEEKDKGAESALSYAEIEEYSSLALAYVHLKLSNWVCVQSILKKFLKTDTLSDHPRYGNYLRCNNFICV